MNRQDNDMTRIMWSSLMARELKERGLGERVGGPFRVCVQNTPPDIDGMVRVSLRLSSLEDGPLNGLQVQREIHLPSEVLREEAKLIGDTMRELQNDLWAATDPLRFAVWEARKALTDTPQKEDP